MSQRLLLRFPAASFTQNSNARSGCTAGPAALASLSCKLATGLSVNVVEVGLDFMQSLDHVTHFRIQLHDQLVLASLQVVEAAAHVGQGLLSFLQVCSEAVLLQLLNVVLEKPPAGHVEEANTASDKGRHEKSAGTWNHILHVDSNKASNQVEGPQPCQHCQLPCIYSDLSTVDVVQRCTATSFPEIDHADAAHRRADVRDRPSDMRRADDCTEM
mmetsp:Transcript_63002/g.150509  ORF Transcript_63002/g.150509 Transcript_63002/m.150509 type:complete len:215 (-) Transcript_63002:26-670(-)